MASIYDQHRAAFASVDAAVILHGSKRVATIAFKYPRDGAGRLYAYIHWAGIPMVRGVASGGGYDKHTAACADAARKLSLEEGAYADGTPHHDAVERTAFAQFKHALGKDSGRDWERVLQDEGFTVYRAI